MKKKYLILTGLIFSCVGWQPVGAQTDVTDKYIKNAGFENLPVTFAEATGATPQTERNASYKAFFAVTDWTNASYQQSNSVQVSTVEYGFSAAVEDGLNGTTPPANDKSGKGGSCLFMSANWNTDRAVLTQAVFLPVGRYALTYDVCNQGPGTTIVNNYTGVVLADGTTVYGTKSSATMGQWESETVYFTVGTQQEVKISVGFMTGTQGSGSAAKLYVDNIKLEQWGLTGSSDAPEDYTSHLNGGRPAWGDKASWIGAGGYYGSTGYVERYQDSAIPGVGEYLSQTLTGLCVGVYDVELFACSSATVPGRGVITPVAEDGGTRYASVSANDVSRPIATYNRLSVDVEAEKVFALTDVKVTDGTLKLSVNIDESGPNWMIVKPVSLKYKGIDKESLTYVIKEAGTMDRNAMNEYIRGLLDKAVADAQNAQQTGEGLNAAYAALIDAIAVADVMSKEYVSAKGRIDDYEAILVNSFATADAKAAYKNVIDAVRGSVEGAKSVAELKERVLPLEDGRQSYLRGGAEPMSGYVFDMTFMIGNAAVASADGWTDANTNRGQQYTDAPDDTYFDVWQSTINVKQKVSGLAQGKYSLKAATRAYAGVGNANIYVETSATETVRTDIHKQGNTGNTLGNGWGWTVVDNINVTSGEITIGFYAQCGTGQWAGADDFHLYYHGGSKSTSYAHLQQEIAVAKSLGIDVAAEENAYDNVTYTSEEATEATQRLNVAIYNKVKADYTYDYPVGNWNGEIGTANGQHWSGDSRDYYDTNGSDIKRALTATVKLPAGEYVLMAAGRSAPAATMELDVDGKNVVFTAKGDTGFGIDTEGNANFSADGSYAYDGKGRGWEWECVPLTLDEEKDVTLKATITTSGWAWGSFTDIKLKMGKETFETLYYTKLAAALEECKPWTEDGEYVTRYAAWKKAYDNKEYRESQEIETAIGDMRQAYKAYAYDNASMEHPYDVTDKIKDFECSNNDGWPGSGRTVSSGQHWSGDAGRVYFTQNHENGSARSQQITLDEPGVYLLKTSVRIVGQGAYATISVADRETTVAGRAGITGGTIATDGTEWESVEAGIKAGKVFANDNKGFGWVYNNVIFGAGGEDDLNPTISISLSNLNVDREADCGGMKLYYVGRSYVEENNGLSTYLGVFEPATAVEVTDDTPAADLRHASISNVSRTNPNGLVYVRTGQMSADENIVVDGRCENFRLTDMHPFVAPLGFTAGNASYTMTAVAQNAGGEGFGTLCLPFEVDLSGTGKEAYLLNQGVTAGGEVYAAAVNSIPANTPVLVKAAGEYTAKETSVAANKAGATYEGGELVGVYVATEAPVGSYVLQKHGEKVAFYPVVSTQPVVSPFRAYIHRQNGAAWVNVLSVVFDFDGVTGIERVEAFDEAAEVERYDAAGMKISSPQKGINIIRMSDGTMRKVMVK